MEEESRELNFLLIRYLERITSISGKGGHPPEWFKNLVGYFEQQNLLPQLEIPNFDGPPSTISKFEDIAKHLNVPQEQLRFIIDFARSKYIPSFSTVSTSLLSTTQNSMATLGRSVLSQPPSPEQSNGEKISNPVECANTVKFLRFAKEFRDRELSGINFRACSTTELLSTSLDHIQTFIGHKNSVYCVKMDHAETRFFTGSDDCTVKVWSLSSGELLKTLRGHTEEITDMSVSSDDLYLVSSANDATIRVWSLLDYSCKRCILAPYCPLVSVTFWNCDCSEANEQEQNDALSVLSQEKQKNTATQSVVTQTNEVNNNKDLNDNNNENHTNVSPFPEHNTTARTMRQKHKRKRVVSDSDFEPDTNEMDTENSPNIFECIDSAADIPLSSTSPHLAHVLVATDYWGKVFFWDADAIDDKPLLTLQVSCIENCYCCHPDSRIFSENYETSINRVHAHIGQLSDNAKLYIAGGKIVTAWKLYPGLTNERKIVIGAKIVFAYSSITEKTTVSFAHHSDAFLVEGIETHGTIVRLKEPENNIPPTFCDLKVLNKTSQLSKTHQKKSRMEMCIWDPTDRFVITAAHDKVLRLWDAENGSLLRCFSTHTGQPYVLLNVPWMFNETDIQDPTFSKFTDANTLSLPTDSTAKQQRLKGESGFYFCSAGYDGMVAIWCSLISKPLFVLRKSPNNKDFPEIQFTEGVCNRDGTKFIFVTEQSQTVLIGSGCKTNYVFPCEQFFQNDYQPCVQDAEGNIVDSVTHVAPHLLPNGPLQNLHGEPYEGHDEVASLDKIRYTTISGCLFVPGSLEAALPLTKQKTKTRNSGALQQEVSETELTTVSDITHTPERHALTDEHQTSEREARVEAEIRLMREAEEERPEPSGNRAPMPEYYDDDDDADYSETDSTDDDEDSSKSLDEESDDPDTSIDRVDEQVDNRNEPGNRNTRRAKPKIPTQSTRRKTTAAQRRRSTRNPLTGDFTSDEDYTDSTRQDYYRQYSDATASEDSDAGNDEGFPPHSTKRRQKRKTAAIQFTPMQTRSRTLSSLHTREQQQNSTAQARAQQAEEKRYHTRSSGPSEELALPELPPRSTRKERVQRSPRREKEREHEGQNSSPIAPFAESVDQALFDFAEALRYGSNRVHDPSESEQDSMSIAPPNASSDLDDESLSGSPQPPERQLSLRTSPRKLRTRKTRQANAARSSSSSDDDSVAPPSRKQRNRQPRPHQQGVKRRKAENENSDEDFTP